MNRINVVSSHRPIQAAVQQTGTDWLDDVIEIEASNDSEVFVNDDSCSEKINDDPNPSVCNQPIKENVGFEIVRMAAEEDENRLSSNENQENHSLKDQNITFVIESSESEAEREAEGDAEVEQDEPKEVEQPKEQERSKKQKRKRKRKCWNIRKTQKKKQGMAIGSKETKKHKCALCRYSTSNKRNLVRHIPMHSRKKYLKCTICTKKLSTSRALRGHMTIHDRDPSSFRCSICRWEFTREKPCKVHEERCKRGLKMYECHLCRVMAHNKNHLEKHMRSHTGEVNHCSKCEKQFTSKLGLTQHMKKHAELFAFKCKKCLEVFSYQDEWESHESRCKQRQYKCEVCKRVFTNTGQLKYHLQRNHLNVPKVEKCLGFKGWGPISKTYSNQN